MGRKRIEQVVEPLTAYIPEEINLIEVQKKKPYKDGVNEAGLCYVLGYMVICINFKHKKNYRGGAPLSSVSLKKLFRKYNFLIKYLVDAKIIVLKKKHRKGKNPRLYDFTKKYRNRFKPVTITDPRLLKIHYRNVERKKMETIARYPYLTKWFNSSLRLDLDSFYKDNLSSAVDITQLANVTGSIEEVGHIDSALRFGKQDYSYSCDTSSGRLHSSITGLRKVFRRYITVDGTHLGQADLKASQIYFLSVFLNSILGDYDNDLLDKALVFSELGIKRRLAKSISTSYTFINLQHDTAKFTALVESGQAYEHFAKAMQSKLIDVIEREKITRGYAKDALIQFLFARNNSRKDNITKLRPIFKANYPSLHAFIYEIKKNGHEVFSVWLQSLERFYVLDVLAKEFSEQHQEICIYSLHDALICKVSDLELLQKFLNERLKQLTGIKAIWEIKRWDE